MRNIIIGTIILIVLIFGGTIGWSLTQKWKITVKKNIPSEDNIVSSKEEIPAEEKEVFALTGQVLRINNENNFLIVKSARDRKELIRLNISDDTGLIKIELPEERSEEGYIITEKTEINLSDFKEGDFVSIRSSENIIGKTELDQIISVNLLPR